MGCNRRLTQLAAAWTRPVAPPSVVENSSVYRPLSPIPAPVRQAWSRTAGASRATGASQRSFAPRRCGNGRTTPAAGDNRSSRLPLVARVQEADDEDDGRECGSALCVDRMKASLTLCPLQSEATTHLQFRKQD